jgi:hypothetical protein
MFANDTIQYICAIIFPFLLLRFHDNDFLVWHWARAAVEIIGGVVLFWVFLTVPFSSCLIRLLTTHLSLVTTVSEEKIGRQDLKEIVCLGGKNFICLFACLSVCIPSILGCGKVRRLGHWIGEFIWCLRGAEGKLIRLDRPVLAHAKQKK